VALIAAFVIALALTPIAARIADRLGVVDHPGPLKVQQRPIPYGGGVAILVAIAVPVARTHASLLIPLSIACALGFADDTRELPVPFRIAAELGIGVLTAWVSAPHSAVYLIVSVALVLVLLNAANLLDGLDGLLSGVAVAGLIGFYVILSGSSAVLALALVGALAAFLVWNRPPARIYLGDAGSYLVGTALAILFMSAVRVGTPQGCAASLFVAVCVGDTIVAIVRRIRAHKPVLQGDRGHVYDQLVDRGWSVRIVILVCTAAQFVLTTEGVAVASFDAGAAVAITVATIAVVGAGALAFFTSPRTWVTDA
jgi:UDP-N-acetylmuramyl pentapeptide phosphotransferase/UDP-N-acetylglucosamine-1-phosphate transferase